MNFEFLVFSIIVPASRRPTFQYPGKTIYCELSTVFNFCQLIDIKNSLNNANSILKNIGGPGM